MNTDIRIELLKLASGERLLRFEHSISGLCLEKRLDDKAPVAAQKAHWQRIFAALLERELKAA
jgi:hypothetical protein